MAHRIFSRSQLSATGVLAAMLVAAIVLVPLWSSDVPPLLDYPNHLARQYIIFKLPQSALLQQFYQVQWTATPYLAMDGIVRLLATFLAVDTASKVFVSIALASVAVAPLALNLALFGRVTPIALVGLLFVHSGTVSLGFVNYVFSAGFAICLLALWIALRNGAAWRKFALFPILSTLLYFSHLVGFVTYAVVVGAYELGRHVGRVREQPAGARSFFAALPRLELASLAVQFVLPAAIQLLFRPASSVLAEITYGGLWRKLELLGGLFFNLIEPYAWTLDRGLAIGLTAAAVLLAATRRLVIPAPMLWPLVAMALLVIAMPMELFGGWGADHRLLLPLGMLVAGSVRLKSWSRTGWTIAVAILAALVVARVAAITIDWRKANAEYAAYQRAFDALPDGSTVYFAFGHAGEQKIWPHPEYHIPFLALKTKQVYMPYLFTAANIVMRYAPAYENLQRASKGPVLMYHASPNWQALLTSYDYALLVNDQLFDTPVPRELVPVVQEGKVRLYRNSLRN